MFVDLYFRSLIFGTFSGKRLCEVPTDYLRWMACDLDGLTDQERSAVNMEIAERDHRCRSRRAYTGTPVPAAFHMTGGRP